MEVVFLGNEVFCGSFCIGRVELFGMPFLLYWELTQIVKI